MYNSEQQAPMLVLLLQAAATVQAHVEAKLAAIELSLPKLAALAALHDAGEVLPLTQLAARLSCVKSNITQLVERLESDGLVRRLSDPNDRRTRLAILTPAGRRALERGMRIRTLAETDLFGRLSPDELRDLELILKKLQQRVSIHAGPAAAR